MISNRFDNLNNRSIYYFILIGLLLPEILFYVFNQMSAFLYYSAIILGVYIYFFCHIKNPNIKLHNDTSLDIKIKLCLNILFILLFVISILSANSYAYKKEFLYYLCIAFLAGLVFIDILFLESFKKSFILFKIILLGLNIYLSNLLAFPYGVGASGDTFYQIYRMAAPITENGHIPVNEKYTFFPVHQILVSMSSQLSSINTEMTYFLMAAAVVTIGNLFIFLTVNKLLGFRAGLLSSLFYISSGDIIYQATHPFQTTYALPFVIMITYILLTEFNSNVVQYRILFLILLTTLVFTHAHSTGVALLICLLATICYSLCNFLELRKWNFLANKALVFFVLALCYWIFYAMYFHNVSNIIVVYMNTFLNENEYSNAVTLSAQKFFIPFKLLLLDKIYYISLTISTIGFLSSLKNTKFPNLFTNSFSFLLISVVTIGMFIKVPILASSRLFTFLEAIGFTFLSAYTIIHIIDLNKLISKRNVSIFFIIVALAFFATSSSVSGIETSLYTKSTVPFEKRFDTPNERYAILWANTHIKSNSNTLISPNFIPYLYSQFNEYTIKNSSIDLSNMNKKYILFNSFDITSGVRVDFSERYGATVVYLNKSSLSDLNLHDKYYANGVIDIFYIKNIKVLT